MARSWARSLGFCWSCLKVSRWRDEGGAREASAGAGHAVEDVAAGLHGLEVAAGDGEVERGVGLGELGEECGVAVDGVGLGFDVGAEVLPVGVRGTGWRRGIVGSKEEQGQEKGDAAHALEYSGFVRRDLSG